MLNSKMYKKYYPVKSSADIVNMDITDKKKLVSKLQDKSVSELSLDACLAFNKLYDVLQAEQKSLLNDIEIDLPEDM